MFFTLILLTFIYVDKSHMLQNMKLQSKLFFKRKIIVHQIYFTLLFLLLFAFSFLIYYKLALEKMHCSPDEFRCNDKTCIESYQHCDGKYDCPDYSDEQNCSKF